MKTTVETLEPYILEGRESIKAIVGHLMAVKAGDYGRIQEALLETRALREASRRAEFAKVVHLCANMESLIEAAQQEGPEQIQESLELLCDMCAHIVLYVDTVLLYADTFAMLIEFPWMRDALSRRLTHLSPEQVLGDPAAFTQMVTPKSEGPQAVIRMRVGADEDNPETTLNELQALYEEGPKEANWVIDLSSVREVPLWLMGTLMSYRVELGRQGRRIQVTGLSRDNAPGGTLGRFSAAFADERSLVPA